MAVKRRRGMNPLVVVLLCLLIVIVSVGVTGYLYMKEKYAGDAVAYSRQAIRDLDEDSGEARIAKMFYTDEQWESMRNDTVPERPKEINTGGTVDADGVEIVHITGSTYEGYMMIVHDQKRLKVAVNPNMDNGMQAPSLEDYVRMNNAVGGINAGGFMDAGGTGNGGRAWGIVIHNGKLISGSMNEYLPIIGIDDKYNLYCVDATAKDALSWGIQEAVTFGPVFIRNYEVLFRKGQGDYPMLNPRTAIGQSSDGSFLLLTIDGRGPSSFGSLYEDVVEIFQKYDAVNAANLDGGNSTAMIYNGDYVNTTVSMYGSRHLPTAFIVEGE